MSVLAMTAVWQHSRQKEGSLLILLALADFAHDDGSGAFPSVQTLADKARMSERNTRYCLRKLEEAGEIVREGQHPSGTTMYRVVLPHTGGQILPGANIAGGAIGDTEGGQFATSGGGNPLPPNRHIEDEPLDEPLGIARARKAAPKKKPKTLLTEDWEPDFAGRAFAQKHGWGSERIDRETERFRAHHEKEATESASWPASWRTWVLNGVGFDERDRRRARASPNGRSPTAPTAEDFLTYAQTLKQEQT